METEIEDIEITQAPPAPTPKKSTILDKIFGSLNPSEGNERLAWEREMNCDTHDLGYELMREDGVCKLRDGVYARIVRFEDVNYQGAQKQIQADIHQHLTELINSFDVDAGFQWYIETRRYGKAEFNAEMHYKDVPGDDLFNDLRHEQNMILENQISESSYNVRRSLYLVIRIAAPNMSKAKNLLDRMISTAEQKFSDIGSSCTALTGREWLELINHVTNPEDTSGVVSYDDLLAMPGTSTLDLVAPPDLTKAKTGFSYGEHFGQVLYLQKYSNSVRDDFLSAIAELPQNTCVSLHVSPIDQADAIELVEGQLLNVKQEKRNYIVAHPKTAMLDDEMLPGSLGDMLKAARETRDDLVHYDQKFFAMTIVVMCYDKDPLLLESYIEEVKKLGRKFTCRFANFPRQIDGLKACLPLANNESLPERKVMSDALANFVPFTSDELVQPGGMYMGINNVSKNHMFYNRKTAVAPNGFILGKPGRGKSFTAKGQIMWTLLTNPEDRVIVLDPEGEYGALCELLNGTMIKLSSASETHVNIFDINENYSDDENSHADPLELKTDFILSVVNQMAKGLTSLQESIVDRTVAQIYQPYFESKEPEDIPTLQDFYETLKNQPEDEAVELATTIERYISGSMRIFNHKTTDDVDMTNRFIVFDIKDLPQNLKALGLLIVLDQTWNFISSGRSSGSSTWFFVDELQLLLDDEGAIEYFDKLYTRSRKWGAIPTGITQNVTRLLSTKQTSLMVQNSDYLIILGQSSRDAEALAEILELSKNQTNAIKTASPGSGLLIAEKKVIPYTYVVPKELNGTPTKMYQALTTKLTDLFDADGNPIS